MPAPIVRPVPKVVWRHELLPRERDRRSAAAWVNDILVEAKDG